jgi:methionine synthase II (cobalamin-independent)
MSAPTKSINSNPVPSWVRNNAEWWSKGLIGEEDFLSGIQFLINQGIIKVSTSNNSQQLSLPFVPNWIKDTARWWSEGKVTDQDFLNGIKYLVEVRIIKI